MFKYIKWRVINRQLVSLVVSLSYAVLGLDNIFGGFRWNLVALPGKMRGFFAFGSE
jgi:hypothetical protein